MSQRPIQTPAAPAAIGPYSQAIIAADLLFCSGQIPLRPDGTLIEGDIEEQTRQVMQNLQAVLAAAGLGFDAVVKTTVYLTDLGEFARFNAIYASHFSDAPPARSTVQVAALPRGARVEIDLIARL